MPKNLPVWRRDAPSVTRRKRRDARRSPVFRRPGAAVPRAPTPPDDAKLPPALREALWAFILGLPAAWIVAEAALWLGG